MLPIANVIVILSGAAGLALADFIRRKKIAGDKLDCPAGSDCEVVIYSRQSVFLGMPVETLGGIYYLAILLSYSFFLFFPQFHSEFFSFGVILLTTTAFIFSIYLAFVQLIVLKQWCLWCIYSAILCFVIFTLVWSSTRVNLIEFASLMGNIF